MKKRQNKALWLVYAAAFCAMLFWGCSFVWSIIVFQYWDPVTTIFLRLLFSSGLLFLMLKLFGKIEKVDRSDYKTLFLLALFNPFLYFLGESFGLLYSSATISAAIIATIPVFTTTMAFFVLNERLRIFNFVGIAISFFGVLLILFNKNMELETTTWYGVLLLFLAVAASTAYSVFIRPVSLKYNPFTIIAWQNIIGALLFLPLFLIFGFNNLMTIPLHADLLYSFLMLLLLSSTLAFPFYIFAISRIGVSRASIFSNLIPVVTAIVSFFILKEQFTVNKIMGICLVISGVCLSQLKIFKKLS